ncbi:MAG: virulence-associated E family protein [Clostridium sp.]|uniref:virulence-associated E family protein n=1 Tax=Clostridium sp. TaxID=1506 RepID=UPI00290402A3|nr:virulence-associated E family protein [Clostridium sp.]MDU1980053.1 virulence-associated E family protein [Clostridium sp.]
MDTTIIIATGRSRSARCWKSQKMTWSALANKLAEPTVTNETAAEYAKMSKADQGQKKDVGGFVGGYIPKNGRRVRGAVKERYLITLDADNPGEDFIVDLDMELGGVEYVLYSTHSHTADNPRYRVIIPVDRPMTPDEYQAVSRRIADNIGIEFFDPSTHQAERLMYWPSHPKDVEYVYQHSEGSLVSVDTYLSTYRDWRDTSLWPTSEKESQIRLDAAKKQGNPLEKKGLIGAFCRCYSITEAIHKFLPEVYEPTAVEDRYTYVAGSSVGGLVIYDNDTFAYSNHATDPISGKLVNAFDLVRIHLFGDKDPADETSVTKLPSYKDMIDFVNEDGAAPILLDKERMADMEFEDITEDDEDFLSKLKRDKNGTPESDVFNCLVVLKQDPTLKGKIRLDEFAHRLVVIDDLPWRDKDETPYWTDTDDACLRNYFATKYLIKGKGIIDDALQEVTQDNKFHPVREYLKGLTWDGECRLDTLFIDYIGAEDTEYIRAVTRKWMCGAVARVMDPGVKFDTAIVLYGSQGLGKSLILERLGRKWFNNSLVDIKTKDALEQIQGSWIVELAELAPTYKNDNEIVKAFISRTSDRFRSPYGRRTEEYPRQCVFAGSTNNLMFLKDRTGNRRFWPITGDKDRKTKNSWDLSKAEIDQLWAEAFVYWSEGEPLVLEGALEEEALRIQLSHTEGGELVGLIEEYLDMLLPEDWETMDIYDRRDYVANYGDDDHCGSVQRERVCALEIWCEVLGGDRKNLQNAKAREIIDILQSTPGWNPYTKGTGKARFGGLYGPQRAFIKEGTDLLSMYKRNHGK